MKRVVKLRQVAGCMVISIPADLVLAAGFSPGDRVQLEIAPGTPRPDGDPVPIMVTFYSRD